MCLSEIFSNMATRPAQTETHCALRWSVAIVEKDVQRRLHAASGSQRFSGRDGNTGERVEHERRGPTRRD